MVASDILSGCGINFYSLVLYKIQSLLADKTPKEGFVTTEFLFEHLWELTVRGVQRKPLPALADSKCLSSK